VIYFCDAKAEFKALLLQSSVTRSFRDHSEMLIFCSRNIIVKNSFAV